MELRRKTTWPLQRSVGRFSLSDAAGTSYSLGGSHHGGMGAELKGDTRSRPGSPDDATSLTVTWAVGDVRPAAIPDVPQWVTPPVIWDRRRNYGSRRLRNSTVPVPNARILLARSSKLTVAGSLADRATAAARLSH